MFDEDSFEDPVQRPLLMRAMLIAPDAVLASIWRRVLRQASFDTVVAHDGIAAVRMSSQHGMDLFVVAGDLGELGLGELSLLRRGLFGPIPPPIIILRSEPHQEALAEVKSFSGCVVVGAASEHNFPGAIELAFALRQSADQKGDDHA